MSWSGRATVGLLVPDWDKVVDNMVCSGQENLPEAQEQIALAKVATKSLVAECVVSHIGKNVSVNLSGHATPKHEEKEGEALEYVSIQIHALRDT